MCICARCSSGLADFPVSHFISKKVARSNHLKDTKLVWQTPTRACTSMQYCTTSPRTEFGSCKSCSNDAASMLQGKGMQTLSLQPARLMVRNEMFRPEVLQILRDFATSKMRHPSKLGATRRRCDQIAAHVITSSALSLEVFLSCWWAACAWRLLSCHCQPLGLAPA